MLQAFENGRERARLPFNPRAGMPDLHDMTSPRCTGHYLVRAAILRHRAGERNDLNPFDDGPRPVAFRHRLDGVSP